MGFLFMILMSNIFCTMPEKELANRLDAINFRVIDIRKMLLDERGKASEQRELIIELLKESK